MKFTEEDISLLLSNYSDRGASEMATFLNRTVKSIQCKAHCLGLKLNTETRKTIFTKCKEKPMNEFSVDVGQFLEIRRPEIAYILGLLWADGHIGGGDHDISLSCIEDDAVFFLEIFLRTGRWRSYKRTRHGYKNTLRIRTYNKFIYSFLEENGYKSKSFGCAFKILDRIPTELQKYWFQGLVDGDGCFYYDRKTGRNPEMTIASGINQDWNYMANICNKLNIKYSIQTHISKLGHSRSSFRIRGRRMVVLFGCYLYGTDGQDLLGLPRKFKIYNEIRGLSRNKNKLLQIPHQP